MDEQRNKGRKNAQGKRVLWPKGWGDGPLRVAIVSSKARDGGLG